MSTLTLSTQPGFTDIPDSALNAGNPVTATTLKAVKNDAEFAAVRSEEFWGYYKHGETVQLPVSPADGYEYTRQELFYTWMWYWTGRPPSSPLNGTQTLPARGATTPGGTLLSLGSIVDQATGLITLDVSYFNGNTTNSNDGILIVMIHAKRSR